MPFVNPGDANIPTILKGSCKMPTQTCGQKICKCFFLGINESPGLMGQSWTEGGKNSALALTEQVVMFKF